MKIDKGSDDFVMVLETYNAGDRVFIKSIFDAEGINYFIQNENAAPYLFNAVPMRVMVLREDEEKAKEILKDIKMSFTYNLRSNSDDSENHEE